jgi:hypothetical protein
MKINPAQVFSSRVLLLAALALSAGALLAGVPLSLDASPLLLAMAVASAPAAERPFVAWGRKREPMKTFQNVGANQTAYSLVPRYPRTLLGFMLERGGTTFTEAQLTRLELFLGEKSIWGPVSCAEVRMTERYVNGQKESGNDVGNDPYWVPMDFTFQNVKEIGGEQIGGIDLATLPEGQLRVEAEIGGATAPTLRGEVVWGPPQGGGDFGGLMCKLVKRTYPQAAAGDWYPDVDVRGAILCRQFFKGTVYNNAVSTAHTAANAGTVNTGNGAASATVSSLTPAGRYHAVCVEPGANVGTFIVWNPKGQYDGTVVTAAGAVTLPSGLVVTIADGGTDFIVGDGFFFDVLPNNTDGNINLVEVKKNEDYWFFARDRAARFQEQRYGRTPMAGLLVADYLLDNHIDSVLDTANAAALDYRVNLTAQDTVFIIHQLLARPTFNARN